MFEQKILFKKLFFSSKIVGAINNEVEGQLFFTFFPGKLIVNDVS